MLEQHLRLEPVRTTDPLFLSIASKACLFGKVSAIPARHGAPEECGPLFR